MGCRYAGSNDSFYRHGSSIRHRGSGRPSGFICAIGRARMIGLDKPARPKGMELFELRPVIVGGDPVSPENKAWLTREQHFEAVRYWNRIVRSLRDGPK